jgi:hypothetical protein
MSSFDISKYKVIKVEDIPEDLIPLLPSPHLNNLISSPADERDFKIGNVKTTLTPPEDLPVSMDLSKFLMPIRNQGKASSCVAFATCSAREFHAVKLQKVGYYLSPQFIYDLRSNSEAGVVFREMLDIIIKYGVCPDKTYPPRDDDEKNTVSQIAFKQATAFRTSSYWRVNTVEECMMALYEHGPCVFSVPAFENALRKDYLRFWKPFDEIELDVRVAMGHVMCIVGYDKTLNAFIVRNSYGETWGKNGGYTVLPFEDWQYITECWCIVPYLPAAPDPLAEIQIDVSTKLKIDTKTLLYIVAVIIFVIIIISIIGYLMSRQNAYDNHPVFPAMPAVPSIQPSISSIHPLQ